MDKSFQPLVKNLSLMELIKSNSHTTVQQLTFDCPLMEFSPRPEIIDQIGLTTWVKKEP